MVEAASTTITTQLLDNTELSFLLAAKVPSKIPPKKFPTLFPETECPYTFHRSQEEDARQRPHGNTATLLPMPSSANWPSCRCKYQSADLGTASVSGKPPTALRLSRTLVVCPALVASPCVCLLSFVSGNDIPMVRPVSTAK